MNIYEIAIKVINWIFYACVSRNSQRKKSQKKKKPDKKKKKNLKEKVDYVQIGFILT